MPLTTENINVILYFCREKGDPERIIDWQDLLPQVSIQFPELIEAWEARKAAVKRFYEVVDKIEAEQEPTR